MEVDENNSAETNQRSRRKSPHASARKGIVLNKPLSARIGEMSQQPQGYAPSKMMLSTRRSSSGIFITTMFGARFRHLQKLHSDAFTLGLNGVCFPGLPVGTMFRSSLPATPVSTPIHREFHHFTEQAIRERLCRTPSPRKNRSFGPLSLTNTSRPNSHPSDGLNSLNSSNFSTSDGCQPMDITTPTTPIAENIDEESMSEASSEKAPMGGRGDEKPPVSSRKLFVGNISYRMTEKDLYSFFHQFGKVEDSVVIKDHVTKLSKGHVFSLFGFVTFYKCSDAEKALSASPEQLILDQRQLRLNLAQPKVTKTLKQSISEKKQEKEERLISRTEAVKSIRENQIVYGSVVVNTGTKNINDLNDDLLLLIFAKIENIQDKTRCERVCTRWRQLVLSSWETIDRLNFFSTFYSFDAPALTTEVLVSILKKCPSTKHLNLGDVTNSLDTKACELIAKCCPLLESINLKKAAITHYGLKVLGNTCSNLKVVNLNHCANINEKGLWYLLNGVPNLESLQIQSNQKITGVCFRKLQNIKYLDISFCNNVEEKGFTQLSKNAGSLEVLKTGPVTVNIMRIICGLKSLKHLEIVSSVDDITGFSFIHQLSNLEILKINPCFTDCTDEQFITLIKSCEKLKVLEIEDANRLTDVSVKLVAAHCPDIRELMLSNSRISDESVLTFTSFHNLQSLQIDGSEVKDNSVKQLLQCCERLDFVNLNNCELITIDLLLFSVQFVKENKNRQQLVIQYGNRRFIPRLCKDHREVEEMFDIDELSAIPEAYYEDFNDAYESEDQDFLAADDPVAEFEREWIS